MANVEACGGIQGQGSLRHGKEGGGGYGRSGKGFRVAGRPQGVDTYATHLDSPAWYLDMMGRRRTESSDRCQPWQLPR